MLLKYRVKTDIIVRLLLFVIKILPVEFIVIFFVMYNGTIITCIIIAIVYCIFVETLKIKYNSKLQNFYTQLSRWLYVHRYVLRGKAISKRDFKLIRNKNRELYEFIINLHTNGYCYSICFDILDCLAKGEILFVAVREIKTGGKYNLCKHNKNYTMHVLYVFNDWCYDTYSEMQYPLEEVLRRSKAKIYKSFSYKDIQGKSYYEFRAEHIKELRKWCKGNDCYQMW